MIARFKLKVSLCQITHAQTNKCHLYQMRYDQKTQYMGYGHSTIIGSPYLDRFSWRYIIIPAEDQMIKLTIQG